ncbi:hypothetical protein AVEN_171984-1 [Araneus ventricosus]|uniref:Uncharacterized protein n=1 Tax=Araneus ventricosus TaxID=182803 RepID=A0A4Y2LMS3_ARAVE|nr:hypothetical protein AVEN_171984-1 [Araneus ventricosus]
MHRLKAYSHKPHSGGGFVFLVPIHFARFSVENWRPGFGSPFLWTPARRFGYRTVHHNVLSVRPSQVDLFVVFPKNYVRFFRNSFSGIRESLVPARNPCITGDVMNTRTSTRRL